MQYHNKIDSYEFLQNSDDIKLQNMPKTKSTEDKIICISCGAQLASQKTLSNHLLTCGNQVKRKIGDRNKTSLVQLKKRDKKFEKQILEAEKLVEEGNSNKEIIAKTGLTPQHLSNIRSGMMFSISDKTDEELLDIIKENNKKQGIKSPNESKMNKRSYTTETMYEILKNRKLGPAQLGKTYKSKKGTNLSPDSVGRILNGSAKMYPEDFEILGIDEEDYLALLE